MRSPLPRLFALALPTLAALLLAGCWESKELLLDPAHAARPFADGVWSRTDGQDSQRLTSIAGGFYRVHGIGEADAADDAKMLFTPLGDVNGKPAYAFAMRSINDDQLDNWTYGVVRVDGAAFEEWAPSCNDTAELAKRHGATVDQEHGGECVFAKGDELIAALKELAQGSRFDQRYDRRAESGTP
ncbi:MAG TPA: hypothetical protein VGV61_11825 [Thermoanaerobaculia bacterium]|jgi:hypothetical protein|nr:hypothetical protein [Thermoanaerobaculia bacterium]